MKRAWIALVALTALAAPVCAQDAIADHIGMLGLGYFTRDAPLGVRYWMGPGLGLDVGVGFRSESDVSIQENGEARTTSLTTFAIEGGVLKPISSDSNMILFLRPGLGFISEKQIVPDASASAGAGDQATGTETRLSVSVLIGVELFLQKLGFGNLSFGGGTGVAITRSSPAGGGDSKTVIGTVLADVSILESASLGFHFYF